ncbi:cupin domain-containing protein [Modestobacter sp. I12A-02662]|uniref:cupin domain-containing protein n=1 Tax=Modestobacter sp. I12A-02662 TaxID=1730496 RepID=UPI0034DFFA78
MDAAAPPPLTVVRSGEGRLADLGDGLGVAFKLWGEDTDGSIAVVEHPFAVGTYVSAHLHTREDEYSIVLEGEIGFRSGDREVVLGPGGYITKPRGELHAMWNAGQVPARMIEIISPAGFEGFFRDVADLAEAGTTDESAFLAVADAYGLQFGEPDWEADVVRRYGLHPPS